MIATIALGAIVLTGAAVRLTEAGLGCENWPACSEDRIVPELALHPWIEFGNRLISGLVAVAVAVAVLLAYRRIPKRADLVRWAWGLVAGVAGQIVLGGITVRVDLHPAFVSGHFLLSIVLLWNAVVLFVRASSGSARSTPAVSASIIIHGRVLVTLATAALVAGTLVTGTGPHGGDSRAERLRFDLADITRVHTVLVWCFLAAAAVLAIRLQHHGAKAAPVAQWLLVVIAIQGAIGYLQYAIGVPPALVEAHVFGSIIVWTTVIYLQLQLFDRPALDQIINGPEPPDQHRRPPSGGDRLLDEEESRTQVVNAAPTLAKMRS